LHTFKPAEAHTRRNLTVIRLRSSYALFGKLTSLRQNILSAIKVMKGKASKNDEEEQEDEYERFYGCFQYI
jgi:uncharacterized spore protein YtfJ